MVIDLHNQCILVTRPDPQGSELCERIMAHGGRAIHFPTIAFAPPPYPLAYQEALKNLVQQEWIIFISPYAVKVSIPSILKLWPAFPGTAKLATVGAGTAAALNKLGYEVDAYPSSAWNSEALLDLAPFQTVSTKKIAIIRGVGGREKIDQILQSRGAHILPVIAYERVIPRINVTPILELLRKNSINAVVCTSFESIQHLKILLGEAACEEIYNVPLLVSSERIKILAHDLGFRRIWITLHASQATILSTLAEIKDSNK